MDRKAGRALAKTTLEGLGLFGQVEQAEPGAFDAALIAVVHSKGTSLVQEARDLASRVPEIWVSIFVRRAPGAADATEDLLDDLVEAAMNALYDAFAPFVDGLALTSAAAIPDKPIDGKQYRMERFSVRWSDD